MKTSLRIVLLSAAAAALLSAADASAQATASFQVTANVVENCRVEPVANVAIAAAWDPTDGTSPAAVGTVTVRCTRGTTYEIELNGGAYTDAMTHTNGTDTLPYKFYAGDCATDYARTAFTAANRSPSAHAFCAGIDGTDATVDPIAGLYSDTVVAEVIF